MNDYISKMFYAQHKLLKQNIGVILKYADELAEIPILPRDNDVPGAPHWFNEMFPAMDAAALYAFVSEFKPQTIIEIGSGYSTKFARAAIQEHSPRTHLVSIDPGPSEPCDWLCDEIIRQPLSDVDPARFELLRENDIIFLDGSHVASMGSDVVYVLLKVLPKLAPGVFLHIHDIFLPDDYPEEFGMQRGYSEQYVLAGYFMGGALLTRLFWASAHVMQHMEHNKDLYQLWDRIQPHSVDGRPGLQPWGGSLWIQTTTKKVNSKKRREM